MRTVGIEFEFGDSGLEEKGITKEVLHEILKEKIKHIFKKNKVTLSYGRFGNKKSWSFYDMEACGYEFRTPALEANLENIDKISQTAQSFYNKLGKDAIMFMDCGLHVHVDVSDFTRTQIFNLYKLFYMYEECIYRILRKERKKSVHVLSLKKGLNVKNLLLEKDDLESDPFLKNKNKLKQHELAMNIESTKKHKIERVEIRYCHGTLNYETIYFWALLLLFLVESAKENMIEVNKIVDKMTLDNLTNYIKKAKINDSFVSKKRKKIIDWIFYRLNNREIY